MWVRAFRTNVVTCANLHPDCRCVFSLPQIAFALQSRIFIWKCVIFYIHRLRRYVFMNNSTLQRAWQEYTLIMCRSVEPWSTVNIIFSIRKEKHQLIWLWFDIKRTFYLFKYSGNPKLVEANAPLCVQHFECSLISSMELTAHCLDTRRGLWDSDHTGRSGWVLKYLEMPLLCRSCWLFTKLPFEEYFDPPLNMCHVQWGEVALYLIKISRTTF